MPNKPRTLRRLAVQALTAVATLALGTGVAWATNLYILDTDTTFSPISGPDQPLSPVLIGDNGDYQAVYGVKMYESSNLACKATVLTRHINTGSERTASGTVGECSSPGSEQVLQYTQLDRFVRGIQVCTKGSGDRADVLKGLRLYAAELDPTTGALTNVDGYKEFARPNCSEWAPAKFCPVGKVASRIQFERGYYDFSGASLECRSVVPKP